MAPTTKVKGKANHSGQMGRPKRPRLKGKIKPCPNKLGFISEDRWNLKEKERLLAALKTFAPTSIHSLSRFVRTKTPQEVEAKIASIRETNQLNRQKLEDISDDSSRKKAPLEVWLPLVRALVGQEPRDHSKSLSEVIGLIGRSEVAEESLSSKLNWKNIYQFISDLLADRTHLQSLTNLESLVILDVMHDMADALRNSDTLEQRRLLSLKYKYLNADLLCVPQFSNRDQMVAMALSNDFSSVENEATTSSVTSSSSSPSTSAVDTGVNNESMDIASTSSSSSSATQSDIAGSSSSTAQNTAEVAVQPNGQSSSQTPDVRDTSGEATSSKDSSNVIGNKSMKTCFVLDNNSDQAAPKLPPSDTAWTPESGYCRPRYYTLNPFCIPDHLLDFDLKKKS